MKYLLLFIVLLLLSKYPSSAQYFELVADISPQTDGPCPRHFYAFNGKLLFLGNDSIHGEELWSSDGVLTQLLKDINASGNSYPDQFTTFNSRVFFSADDGIHGKELWISDGTTAGTELFFDIDDNESSSPRSMAVIDSLLLFFATKNSDRGLWITDGTPSGTQLIKDDLDEEGPLKSYNGIVIFSANDGINGRELWKSDGTSAGTELIKNINTWPGAGSYPEEFIDYNGKLYFRAKDSDGNELYCTDGTAAGTYLVKDINPLGGSDPMRFVEYDNKIYFNATGGFGSGQLWCSNGTPDSTYLVKDINPGFTSNVYGLTVFNNHLFFAGFNNASGEGMWISDGTESGTKVFLQQDFSPKAIWHDHLYFLSRDTDVYQTWRLWQTDGTDTGSFMIKPDLISNPDSFNALEPTSIATQFIEYSSGLYFPAAFTTEGCALWRLIDYPTGIEGLSSTTTLYLPAFPNPFTTSTNIILDNYKIMSLKLFDRLGSERPFQSSILQQGSKTILMLSRGGLPPGMYFLSVITAEKRSMVKLIAE